MIVLQLRDVQASVEGLERERDFYFGKLRDIEVLCQERQEEAPEVIQQILDVLYATEVCQAYLNHVNPLI